MSVVGADSFIDFFEGTDDSVLSSVGDELAVIDSIEILGGKLGTRLSRLFVGLKLGSEEGYTTEVSPGGRLGLEDGLAEG
mmetsp:Transcript_10831/g.17341  ORF Transcript_10831/g.17341 Transcript_10831/m.17341 type:complete len:80 (-) Transcript_10831:1275-1514(-)